MKAEAAVTLQNTVMQQWIISLLGYKISLWEICKFALGKSEELPKLQGLEITHFE